MKEDSVEEEEESENLNENKKKIIGPTIPKFLESTLKLINSNEEDNQQFSQFNYTNEKEKEKPTNSLDDLLNGFTFAKERTNINHKNKSKKNEIKINSSKIEPINKDSYERILAEERILNLNYDEEMEEYQNKVRGTSLLEMHQEKIAKEKGKNKSASGVNNLMMQPFDRKKTMNVGSVDSKRALNIMQDKSGLKGRFGNKEKYLGF